MSIFNITPERNPDLFSVGAHDEEFDEIESARELAKEYREVGYYEETISTLDSLYEDMFGEEDRFMSEVNE